jgi:hypothetical protein
MLICQRAFGDCLFRSVRPCRIWTGGKTARGYGMKYRLGSGKAGRKQDLVHRIALAEKLGRPIRPGMQSLHHCDNPPCHEPEHLYEGTVSDNMRDMIARGRGRWGAYLLTEADKSEIRRRYATGDVLQRELAAAFGISGNAVSDIVRKKDAGAVRPAAGRPAGSGSPAQQRAAASRRRLLIEPGQRFSRLTVVCEVPASRPRKAECHCDCGGTTTQRLIDLFRGTVHSCGCLGRERLTRPGGIKGIPAATGTGT